MKTQTLLLLGALALSLNTNVSAQGTAFTYQGSLNTGGAPANGVYDLRFTIYDSTNQPGMLIAGPLTNSATAVSNGLFTLTLDFGGGVFTGANRWLDIAVCTNGAATFVALTPRQPITPTPYAITAENVNGFVPASQISGVVPLAQLPAVVVTNNQTSLTLGGTFGGALNGNATTATTAINFSGGLNGDVTGAQSATVVSTVGGVTAANVASAANAANAATSAATPGAIVQRDATASFAATNLMLAGNLYLPSTSTNAGIIYSGTYSLIHSYPGGWGNFFAGPNAGNLTSFVSAANTAVGAGALMSTVASSGNTAVGFDALTSNTNGSANTAVGSRALQNNTNGANNIALGLQAGYNIVSNYNIDIGNQGSATDNGIIRLGTPGTHTNTFIAGVINGNGGGLTNLSASQLTGGTVPLAQLPAAVVTNNETGVNISGTFSGNGAGVTNVSLGNVNSSGIILWPGNFAFASSAVTLGYPSRVIAADLNGDSKPDLVTVNPGIANALIILTNNGLGIFGSNAAPAVGNYPYSGAAADVNGDGKMDLISANLNAGTLTVLTNNGNGVFGFSATLSIGSSSAPVCVITADVNGDGKLDLISANNGVNTLTVFTNNGSGVFGSNATLTVDAGPLFVTAADVNGDGKPDLISVNSTAGTLTVLTNNGSGVFGFNATLNGGSNPRWLAAADINGDGRPDFIVANNNTNTLVILTNNGSGVFGSNATLNVSSGAACVVAADVNGDGKLDLIIGNNSDNTLTVLTNNGSGTFGLCAALAVAGSPQSVVAADVNGDGRLDLVSANSTSPGTLSVFFNVPTYLGNFSGNGSGLNNLNANNLTSGTIPLAQLPVVVLTNNEPNVALGNLSVTGLLSGNGAGLTNLNAANLTGSASNLTLTGSLYLPLPSSKVLVYSANVPLLTLDGTDDSFMGLHAGNGAMSGWQGDTGFGFWALNALTTGFDNTALGSGALESDNSGSDNTAIGYASMANNTNGIDNTAVGCNTLNQNISGSANIAIGTSALIKMISGSANVAVGNVALEYSTNGFGNTAVGWTALLNSTNGNYNVALGYMAGRYLAGGSSNIDLGNTGVATDTNIIRIGTGQAQTYLAGILNGNGGGLTNLNANSLSTGSIPLGILPTEAVTNNESGVTLGSLTVNGTFSATNTIYVDANAMNSNSINPGLIFGGTGSTEGIASRRNGAITNGQYGLDFYTANGVRMRIRNDGNVGIANSNPTNLLMVSNARCDGSSWINASDRNLKQDFMMVNPQTVLEKVSALPVQTWSYKAQPGEKHLGPVAQDFHAAFGLGADDVSIATVDESGVALAAIQGLNQKLNEKDVEIQNLKQSVAELKELLQTLAEKK